MVGNWTVRQLADFSDVNRSTIQKRATDYKWALSDEAVPRKGKARKFTPSDVAVMVEIDRLAKENLPHKEIKLSIRAAVDDNEFEAMHNFPEKELPEGSVSLVEHSQMMARAETLVTQAQQRAETAEEELQEARETIANLQGQIEVMDKKDRTDELQEKIIELTKQVVRFEEKIKVLEKQ